MMNRGMCARGNDLILSSCIAAIMFSACSVKAGQAEPVILSLDIENAQVRAYMSEVTYDGDYSYSRIESYCNAPGTLWHPAPVIIKPEDNARANMKIWNLTPGKEYIREGLTFVPTGRVRMLFLPSLRNVRDLGGWKSEAFPGKQTAYGRLYRGGEMNTWRKLSSADSLEMRGDLGIDCDLDMRTAAEASDIVSSPLGQDCAYRRKASPEYSKALADAVQCDNFLWILRRLEEGRNVYFHCAKGADRTGTLAFLMEGLLGVSESDLAKDYELTSFFDMRRRSDAAYRDMVKALKTSFPGASLCESCEQYLLTFGATPADIGSFRSIMLE